MQGPISFADMTLTAGGALSTATVNSRDGFLVGKYRYPSAQGYTFSSDLGFFLSPLLGFVFFLNFFKVITSPKAAALRGSILIGKALSQENCARITRNKGFGGKG